MLYEMATYTKYEDYILVYIKSSTQRRSLRTSKPTAIKLILVYDPTS